MTSLSPCERYLRDFHDRTPGVTSAAFAGLPARTQGRGYRSSYDILVTIALEASGSLSLLDVACGDGHLLRLLVESAFSRQLIGVDISQHDLDSAADVLPDDVLLLQERAQALSLGSGTIDVVLSHMALMLLDDIETVLREIRRVLIPGGTLAAIVGRCFLLGEVNDVFQRIFRPFAEKNLPPLRMGDRRTRSVEGWRELLQRGFEDCRFEDVDVPWRATPVELWDALTQTYDIDRLSQEARYRLGEQLIPAWEQLQDDRGCIDTGWGLRLVHARAR